MTWPWQVVGRSRTTFDDMVRLDDSLSDLVDQGLTSFETAYPYFEDAEKRSSVQKRHYRVLPVREVGARR